MAKLDLHISADGFEDLTAQLRGLLYTFTGESAVQPYNVVDRPFTDVQDTEASAADPVTPRQRPRRPKANGSIPRTPQSVESPEPEGQSAEVVASEQPADASETSIAGAPLDAAATVGVGEVVHAINGATAVIKAEDELKEIIPQVREKVAQWRDALGLNWIRELRVEHLEGARLMLKELSS